MNGTVYTESPQQYVKVQARAATPLVEIPSGATAVSGVYYEWNDNGFIGGGWRQNIGGSPINKVWGNISDEDIMIKIGENPEGNLNSVFAAWDTWLDSLSEDEGTKYWDTFYNSVSLECKHRV